MFDLLTKLKNVAANWKDLAFHLIKQDESSVRGKINCYDISLSN